MTDNPQAMRGLAPYLQIGDKGAAAAIDFYKLALGAEEVDRRPAQDGERIMHAALRINGDFLLLCDSFPEYGHAAQTPGGVTIHIQVEDPDAWWARAVAAGATVTMEMELAFWGDRYGQFQDPFGFNWSIGGPDKA